MGIHQRLAYLDQVQALLNTESRGKDDTANLCLTKLNSFYGFLLKEISMKHNVKILNSDPLRQIRCKRCWCQYDLTEMLKNGLVQLNPQNKKNRKQRKRKKKQGKKKSKTNKQTHTYINLKCSHCAFQRKIIFNERNKTKFEKLLFEQDD